MSRRLLFLGAFFGFAAVVWAGTAAAQGRDGITYQPDAVPRVQYDQAFAHQQYTSDQTKGSEYFLAIYSGSTMGTYFYVASGLCRVIDAYFSKHNIHCVPLRSKGVNSNVDLMNQGRAQFIVVQSDTNRNAARGTIDLPDGRSVMSLHDELGLLAVRPDSGIKTVSDLRGKRLNLGPEGTASRELWNELLEIEEIKTSDLATVYAVQQDLNDEGLCEDFIDAYGLWIGHPTPAIGRTLADCGAGLVGMSSPRIDKFVAKHPYYFKKQVPAGSYLGQTEPIDSYGFKASLIANRHADPYIVYWVVKSIQENMDLLHRQHPALSTVEKEEMFEKGNFLPFHPGAARYWREVGFLPPEQTSETNEPSAAGNGG